jgi:hypothetical protein
MWVLKNLVPYRSTWPPCSLESSVSSVELTEVHTDALFQLVYQDGIEVDEDAMLLFQRLPNELRLNFPPVAIKPFS